MIKDNIFHFLLELSTAKEIDVEYLNRKSKELLGQFYPQWKSPSSPDIIVNEPKQYEYFRKEEIKYEV